MDTSEKRKRMREFTPSFKIEWRSLVTNFRARESNLKPLIPILRLKTSRSTQSRVLILSMKAASLELWTWISTHLMKTTLYQEAETPK